MKQTLDIENVRYTGQISDPVGDMLARIRNGAQAQHDVVVMPSSKQLVSVARLLTREGYIEGYDVNDAKYGKVLSVRLKYTNGRQPAITGTKRISKPGRRVYVGHDRLPRVLGGLGIAIVSTSRGVVTGKEASGLGVGGEVVCTVW